MSQYAANVESIWSAQVRSLENRVINAPALSDTDPCAEARHEVTRLRKENFRLQELANQLTTQVLVDEDAKPAVQKLDALPKFQFEDKMTPSRRNAIVEEMLAAINDATVVLSASGNVAMLLECGAMVRAMNDPSKKVGERMSTGGVIVLVYDNGLIVTDKPTQAASPPVRSIYEPDSRASRGGVKMDLSSLRGQVRKALLQPDVQVFASTNGMLSVPCRLYANRPAILYGKLGITFRGDAIKTVGTTGDPKNLGFVAI